MSTATGAMRWGAILVALTAALHIGAFVLSGLSADILWTLPAGVLFGGLAFGLVRGKRWIAYIAFIALLVGISIAASNIWALACLTGWVFAAIAIANLAGVAALFAALWRSPSPVV